MTARGTSRVAAQGQIGVGGGVRAAAISGPEEFALRAQLGDTATFLGPLDRGLLVGVYASADVFLATSKAGALAQALRDAQASGIPVLAVDGQGTASLIEHGRSGLLVPPDVEALSTALLLLAHSPPLRTQLRRGALAAARSRFCETPLRWPAAA